MDPRPGDLIAERFRVVASLEPDPPGDHPVYEVEDDAGQRHALKLYHDPAWPFLEALRGRTWPRHPNLVEVREAGEAARNRPFLVMELLEGETLARALERDGHLDFDEAVMRTLEITAALDALERARLAEPWFVLHHVFLARPDATAKLWDIRVHDWEAELASRDPEYDPSPPDFRRSYVTREMVMGHPPAPTDGAGQIALLSFHLLTGRWYWPEADRLIDRLRLILQGELVPPSRRAAELHSRVGLPRGYDAWFLRCLGPPEERFPDATSAADALAACRLSW